MKNEKNSVRVLRRWACLRGASISSRAQMLKLTGSREPDKQTNQARRERQRQIESVDVDQFVVLDSRCLHNGSSVRFGAAVRALGGDTCSQEFTGAGGGAGEHQQRQMHVQVSESAHDAANSSLQTPPGTHTGSRELEPAVTMTTSRYVIMKTPETHFNDTCLSKHIVTSLLDAKIMSAREVKVKSSCYVQTKDFNIILTDVFLYRKK